MPKSPLLDIQISQGAQIGTMDGWEQAASYGDVTAEVKAVYEHAGLIDQSATGGLLVEGEDAAVFLHNLTTNDVKGLQPGHGCWAYILDPKGKVQADLRIYCIPMSDKRAFILNVPPTLVETVKSTFDRYLIMDDVRITDVTDDWALLALQGPKSADALAEFLGDSVPDLDSLGFTDREVDGVSVSVIRADPAEDLPGFELAVPAHAAPAVWERLAGLGNVTPVGRDAVEILRVERGEPRTGTDLTAENIPIEAGVFEAISYTKGCYLGQEVIARLHAHGDRVSQKLMGLQIDGDAMPAGGDSLENDGKTVGKVTSVVFSPALGRPVAMGMIKRDSNEPGCQLICRSQSGDIPVTVVDRKRIGLAER